MCHKHWKTFQKCNNNSIQSSYTHLVFPAGSSGGGVGAGDLRLQKQQCVEEGSRLSDLAGDVSIGVLPE